MAYDEALAERVRVALEGGTWRELKMFGGLAFMVRGHMALGVLKDSLMVRLGPDGAAFLVEPQAHAMNFTGRAMPTIAEIDPPGFASDADLRKWVERGLAFVGTLPAKE